MGLLIKLLKWVIGKVAAYWIGFLMTAVAAALGITAVVARAWVKHLFEISLYALAVPRYVFWPWLVLTGGGVTLFLWAFFKRPPLTAQNSYRSDIAEGFLW